MTKLLSLSEAAGILGYTTKGFRKIVDRSRAKASGANVTGPTIKFFQTEKGSPVKFKEEWIEEFVDQHTINPTMAIASARSKKKPVPVVPPPKAANDFGFDSQLFEV